MYPPLSWPMRDKGEKDKVSVSGKMLGFRVKFCFPVFFGSLPGISSSGHAVHPHSPSHLGSHLSSLPWAPSSLSPRCLWTSLLLGLPAPLPTSSIPSCSFLAPFPKAHEAGVVGSLPTSLALPGLRASMLTVFSLCGRTSHFPAPGCLLGRDISWAQASLDFPA